MNERAAFYDEAHALLRQATPFPTAAYDMMPPTVTDALPFFGEGTERAVFAVGALPVLAGLLSPGVEIAHADGYVSPDVYACVVAPPSSGKGALKWSRALGEVADTRAYEGSEAERLEWAARPKDEKAGVPEPPERSFYLTANSSAAAFTTALGANGGHGVVFEEEIDTLARALGQDWGNYSDVLRKAFHHEPVMAKRKNERVRIARPALSATLSGTMEQFLDLFRSAENGLFSRYLFYAFDDYAGWRSHRPRAYDEERQAHFRGRARELADLHTALAVRGRSERRLRVRLTTAQWDDHDETYSELERRVVFGQPHASPPVPPLPQRLVANVRRGGLVAVRLAATFAVLREWEREGRDPTGAWAMGADTVRCHDDDVHAALLVVSALMDHAARMFAILEGHRLPSAADRRSLAAYEALPDTFGAEEIEAAAKALGVTARTIRTYREAWIEEGSVEAVPGGWGTYRKVTPELELSAAAALNGHRLEAQREAHAEDGNGALPDFQTFQTSEPSKPRKGPAKGPAKG